MSSHLSKLASLSAARAVATRAPASVHSRKAALRSAWRAHTVKRALAAVNSANDADYRAFGWERGEFIARLQWLCDEIGPAAERRTPAVITLARALRDPQLSLKASQRPKHKPVPNTAAQGG